MRQRIVKILKPLHAVSVENLCGDGGTPDINFVGGWLELKQSAKWPKRASTILKDGVRLPTKRGQKGFTQDQRNWIRERNRKGGVADVCLKVGRDWFLLFGIDAADHLGINWTAADIRHEAYCSWIGTLNEKEFLKAFQA
jgi:hypothetical protein